MTDNNNHDDALDETFRRLKRWTFEDVHNDWENNGPVCIAMNKVRDDKFKEITGWTIDEHSEEMFRRGRNTRAVPRMTKRQCFKYSMKRLQDMWSAPWK